MPDFGHREGFSTLGSYKVTGGLAFVYAPTGDFKNPTVGTVEAWISVGAPWTNVRMVTSYEPVFVSRYPVRTAVGGAVACAFPAVEADALVAAGVATYA